MDDDFANVTWQNDAHGSPAQAPDGTFGDHGQDPGVPHSIASGIVQAEPAGDATDLAGVGSGTLTCTVTVPIKENDGTKDSYVSYLVTTNVCVPLMIINRAYRLAD